MGKGEAKACFLWQHEHGNKWRTYSAEELEAINKALNKKQKTLTLPGSTASKQIVITFEDMVQKNKVSGWEQRIRCCIFDDESFYVWQWKDDDKCWYSYIPSVALELESCHKQGKEKLSFYLNEADYEVNLKDMTQKNEKTGTSRTVKRAKVTVTKAERALLKIAVGSQTTVDDKSDVDADENTVDESGPSSKKKRKMAEKSSEENVCIKTLVLKGKAPVDPECTEKVGKAHVYFEGNDVYDAMLNQTYLQNNNNKYYILQLLEDDGSKTYSVWFRWGRVGKRGQNNLINFGSNLQGAIKDFTQKFYDKTRNSWDEREHFVKVSGKYDLLKMDYSADESSGDAKPAKKTKPLATPKSKLDPKVMSLVELICDLKLMEETVMEMKYDAKKAPLGKLTVEQIKAGYVALKKIEDIICRNEKGSMLVEACNEFYTRIPHDFGMKTPPLIQNTAQIKEKMQMLEALGDIQIAVKMLSDKLGADQHPADNHYHSLQCELKPLDRESSTFKMLEKYLENTHADTHRNYSIEILDIFDCHKEEEKKRFKDVGNKSLLWHGSRLTNYVGILKQGLRIAPPEAPCTGYMFGKGVYFADMCSKSANYCFATKSKNDGLLLLCEVALGECNELINADYNANKLPKGKHSVKGLGRVAPDPKETTDLDGGVKVHFGKPCDTGRKNNYSLNYNEYIVYNVNQIKMKYLFRVKFNFK